MRTRQARAVRVHRLLLVRRARRRAESAAGSCETRSGVSGQVPRPGLGSCLGGTGSPAVKLGVFRHQAGEPHVGRVEGDVVVDLGPGDSVLSPVQDSGHGSKIPLAEVRVAPAFRGRGLRRLLLVARPRDEHGPDVPARPGAADAELAPAADRLPRPRGQRRRERHRRSAGRTGSGRAGEFGPSQKLDFELELGFVIGQAVASSASRSRGARARARLRRGARQRLERARHPGVRVRAARPVPRQVVRHVDLAVGDDARRAHVDNRRRAGARAARLPARSRTSRIDVPLEVELNGRVVSSTNARNLYWNVAQQIAHLTSNGANLRTGDLLATGTISGPGEGERGSLIELTWNEALFSRTVTRSCSGESRWAKFAGESSRRSAGRRRAKLPASPSPSWSCRRAGK